MNMRLARKIKSDNHSIIHLLFVGTKPDIIKLAPLYHELKKRSELVIVCHTGQHYDYNNSRAVIKELGIDIDTNFEVRGTINEKLGQIIKNAGSLISELNVPGKIIIPYVHGDTLTACGSALGAVFQKVAPVHVEAGLRTMTLKTDIYKKYLSAVNNRKFVFSDYLEDLKNIKNYESGSFEPFPEQIDTRMIDVVSSIRFAPNEINYRNLISERNLSSGVMIAGNTISDMIHSALEKPFRDRILSKMDFLNYIFFTIHRRETCECPKRFEIVLQIIENILAEGHRILLIMHPMFQRGIKLYGKDKFRNIQKKYAQNLISLRPIPHYSDAIKVIKNSKLIVTDSGGLQEETNILQKRCVTVRYGTDRIESVIHGNNILAPLFNSKFAMEIINETINMKETDSEPLYGKEVSKKIVDYILAHADRETGLFRTEEQRLGVLRK